MASKRPASKRSSRSSRHSRSNSRRSRAGHHASRRRGNALAYGTQLAKVERLGPPGEWNVYVRYVALSSIPPHNQFIKLRRLLATGSKRSAQAAAETYMARLHGMGDTHAPGGTIVNGVDVILTSKGNGDSSPVYNVNDYPPGAVDAWSYAFGRWKKIPTTSRAFKSSIQAIRTR